MVVNPSHYQAIKIRERVDIENTLFSSENVIDFPLKPADLRRYDEVFV